MLNRGWCGLSLALPIVFLPVRALAEAPTVNFDPAVGCFVAGKFPQLNACFTPSDVVKPRVYFQIEGVPTWYYVDATPGTPCYSGVLPKPTKKLIGKKLLYYAEGTSSSFDTGRGPDQEGIIVESKSECGERPVAAFAPKGPPAVFGGALPPGLELAAGFPVVPAVLGVVAAGAGTAAALSGGDNNPSPSSTPTGSTPTTPPTNPPTTPPTPTSCDANQPPFLDLRTSSGPLQSNAINVTFNSCRSSDPEGGPLHYSWDFGDGTIDDDDGTPCRIDHTYAKGGSYNATGCVTDQCGEKRCKTIPVVDPCSVNSAPTVGITSPKGGFCVTVPRVSPVLEVSATANDDSGVSQVEFELASDPQCDQTQFGTLKQVDTTPDYSASFTVPVESYACQTCVVVTARAIDACGKSSETSIRGTVDVCGGGCYLSLASATSRIIWTSDLAVKGGRGQVVVNGSTALTPGQGRSHAVVPVLDGENRVEAMLVEGSGTPGRWSFQLSGADVLAPGSLRVIAGELVAITADSVVFQMKGKPGERVVFAFRKR